MTTPVNPHYPPTPYPPQPPRPAAKSFWTTTAGVVTGVVLGVALLGVLCLGGCVALIGLGSTSSADATVEITSCDVDSGHALSNVSIGYTLTNTGNRTETFFLDFEVTDGSGARVGDDTEIVSGVAPGATVKGEAFVLLDEFGSRCQLVEVR